MFGREPRPTPESPESWIAVTYVVLGRWICVAVAMPVDHAHTRCCAIATRVAAVRERTPSLR